MTERTSMPDCDLVHAWLVVLEGAASILDPILWTDTVDFIAQFYTDFWMQFNG